MGNQGGKALKWLPAHFNFERKICLLFRECVHKFGTFCPEVRRRTRDGAFIYALSADETSPALAAPRHAITALFSCRKNALALPGGNRIFAATPTERITHYTLRAKSCAKGQTPLETPDNKTGGMLPSPGAYRRLLSAARFTVCV